MIKTIEKLNKSDEIAYEEGIAINMEEQQDYLDEALDDVAAQGGVKALPN